MTSPDQARQSRQAFQPWRPAWQQALYGPAGFYRRPEGPAGHFRTASHAAPTELAEAVRRLAGDHGCTAVVDVGAGRGELLRALAGLPGRDLDYGVDVVSRPGALAPVIGWSAGLPDPAHPIDGPPDGVLEEALHGALVIGWELLDVVPCPILEVDGDGVARMVLVEPSTGRERLGEPAGAGDLDWCEHWWPRAAQHAEEGDRLEVGTARDELWAGLVRRARAAGGRAMLAVDYAHLRDGRPALGSLTGFRAGHAVPPRPDGSMDLTAHVALDAVAAAGLAAGATSSHLSEQHTALRALGVTRHELLDRGALGGFGWLVQSFT